MLQTGKKSSRQPNVSSVVVAARILVTIASVVVYNDKLPVFKEKEQQQQRPFNGL